jgi:hypothetical protein
MKKSIKNCIQEFLQEQQPINSAIFGSYRSLGDSINICPICNNNLTKSTNGFETCQKSYYHNNMHYQINYDDKVKIEMLVLVKNLKDWRFIQKSNKPNQVEIYCVNSDPNNSGVVYNFTEYGKNKWEEIIKSFKDILLLG